MTPEELKKVRLEMTDPSVREAHYKAIYNTLPIPVIVVGFDGTLIDVNPALGELLGYSASELIGGNLRDITHPQHVESSLNDLERLKTGELKQYRATRQYIHKLGYAMWVDVTVVTVDTEEGQFAHCLKSVQEVHMGQEYFRLRHDASGNPSLEPVFSLKKIVADNWKAIAAVLGVLIPGLTTPLVAVVNNYYELKAKLEVQEQEQRKTKEKVEKVDQKVQQQLP